LTRGDGGTFRTKAGAEVGVASTKAYVAQVTAFRVLSIYLGQVRGTLAPAEARQKLQALRQLPKQVEVWLKTDKNRTFTQQIADQMAGQQTLMFLGRGSMVPVAKEGALKMLELAYVFTSGMDLALMKHGFIANFPESRNKRVKRFAIVPLTDRVSFTEALGNLSEIRARYGGVVAICYEADRALAAKNADFVITVPDVPDELAAIVAVVPLQLLAVDTTLAINRVSEEIASLAEQLYMLLQQRGTASGPSDADILKVVVQTQRRFEKLLREGRLDLLPASLIADVQQKITETTESSSPGSLDDNSRELIRVLRGPRLSMIMYFDHELARMTSATNGDVHLKANEGEVLRGFFQQAATSALQPGAVLNKLQQQLSVFLAQAASRGSGLKQGWKEWRFDKGLAEFLARDLDKPRGLAKEVTVDRLSSDLRHELSEMGVPPEIMDSAFLGTMELAGARMREYPGVVRLVANLRGVPESTVRRQAAMHEQAHYILRSLPVYPEILAAADEAIDDADLNGIVADAANYVPFRDRFEQVYGIFSSDAAYLDEVLAKYVSARLTGVGIELFNGVAAELDKVLAGTTFNWSDELKGKIAAQLRVPASDLDAPGKLPQNLAELFGIDFLPQYGPRVSNSSAEVRKAVQLSRFAVALGMNPAIDVRADEQVSADLQQLLANLGHAVRAEAPVQVPAFAGLEQPLPAQLMAERISLPSAASIASSIGVVAGTSDRKGLAYGVALTRVTMSDGTALPVAFVVDTAQQQANLQQMGISPNAIFRAGTPEYGTAADAVAAANRWLTEIYSVGQVVDIGATRPIAQRIQQLLDMVFGIKITSEAAALWDSFIDRATLALQA
jgi:fructoselysine-6-P-deglycase FrlB-like protein